MEVGHSPLFNPAAVGSGAHNGVLSLVHVGAVLRQLIQAEGHPSGLLWTEYSLRFEFRPPGRPARQPQTGAAPVSSPRRPECFDPGYGEIPSPSLPKWWFSFGPGSPQDP